MNGLDSHWRRAGVFAAGLLVTGGAVPLAHQGASQQPAPVFRSRADLVTLDVTVVDRDGKPVKGLKPDDFLVTLDGERRPVRVLDYLEFGTSSAPVGGTPTQTSNQSPATQSRGGRVMLLVVDDLSAKPSQMTSLRIATQRMLATLDAGNLVGLVTTSGLGPAINPTRDRAVVAAALASKDVVGRYDESTAPFFISVPEAIDINRNASQVLYTEDRGDVLASNGTTFTRVVNRECGLYTGAGERRLDDGCSARVVRSAVHLAESIQHRAAAQLEAYTHLITALKSAPSPRVVIALSAGVATGVDPGDVTLLEPVSLAAARAGVQFYALTETGDGADAGDISEDRASARRDEGTFMAASVQTVAAAAGGEAFKVIGQPDRFLSRINAETSGVYQLGVDATTTAPAGEFLKVKVSVTRAGVTVRTNAHALLPSPAAAPLSIEDALQMRIAQGGTAFGVPVTSAIVRRREAGGAVQVGATVQIPAGISAPVVMRFGLVDEKGDIVKAGRQEAAVPAPSDDFWLTFAVAVPAGHYRLRVAVADHEGHIGSVEQPVTAELAAMGPFLVSDVLAMWSGADGPPRFLAVESLPKSAQTLRVSVELYPKEPVDPKAVRVNLAVVPEGETDSLMASDLRPTQTKDAAAGAGQIPLGSLKPGVYTIRASIYLSDVLIGSVSKTIRKVE